MAIIWANGLCISLNLALVFLTVISLLASWSVYFCFSPLYQPSPVLELQLAMMMLVLYWRWAANLTGTLTKSCNRWRATAAKMLNSPRLQNSDDSHQLQNYPNRMRKFLERQLITVNYMYPEAKKYKQVEKNMCFSFRLCLEGVHPAVASSAMFQECYNEGASRGTLRVLFNKQDCWCTHLFALFTTGASHLSLFSLPVNIVLKKQ